MTKRMAFLALPLFAACAHVGGGGSMASEDAPVPDIDAVVAAEHDCPQTRGQVLLDLVNRNRVRAGMQPLGVDQRLIAAAEAQARDLASGAVALGHEGSDGSDPPLRVTREHYVYARVAENVAASTASASIAVTSWMASAGHRHNILTPEFRDAGVAYVDAPGSPNGTYWVMVYGRLQEGLPTRSAGDFHLRCHP